MISITTRLGGKKVYLDRKFGSTTFSFVWYNEDGKNELFHVKNDTSGFYVNGELLHTICQSIENFSAILLEIDENFTSQVSIVGMMEKNKGY